MKHIFSFLLLLTLTNGFSQSYPEGFAEEVAFDEFDFPAGIIHADSTYKFVWELSGKVWLVKNNIVHPVPVIDISEEVGFWTDHGLLSVAIDPDFFSNGYIYLLYAVDRHHLFNFGTSNYDPDETETHTASIGRLTRYTLNLVNLQFPFPDSRKVIIGSEYNNGIPLPAAGHGLGTVMFGIDGSLLLSIGDCSTWDSESDTHGFNGEGPVPQNGYDDVALADGTLSQNENLGSFRSQYLDGYNGKIIRIDPETGFGLPGNPFYDETHPEAIRSKVWSLGFRNPYRMTIRPETGDDDNPGTIFLTDVGDWVCEEINVVSEPGLNYGWPLFQGPSIHYFYVGSPTQNINAPNPLFGSGDCSKEFLDYRNVISQPNAQHNYNYPNPCNETIEVPENTLTFVHERPVLSYSNTLSGSTAIVPTYNAAGEASFISVEDPESQVDGLNFSGISGSGGVFLSGDKIPQEYNDWYIQGDFSGWLRAFKFNELNEPVAIEQWQEYIGAPIHISQDPHDGCIYITSISPPVIKRICFGGNLKPIINVTPDIVYGPSPQQVVFDASDSYDPEGGELEFEWFFGDGNLANGANVTHTYSAPSNDLNIFSTKLKVTDEDGLSDSTFIHVSLNNTPPHAEITSITENQLLSTSFPTSLALTASVTDAEHSMDEMQYYWTIYLHHNSHKHRLDERSTNMDSFAFTPLSCTEHETFWYGVELTVTDPGGLTDKASVELFPDCDNLLSSDWPNADNSVIMYPNPAVDYIELRFKESIKGQTQYQIFDPEGRKVWEESIQVYDDIRYHKINIEAFTSGVYVLKIDINGSKYVERFVKTDD